MRLIVFTVCFLVLSGFETLAEQVRKPNIVLLFADDLGWTDLACFGSDYYETPNLDRLCRQGMKFTDAYSAAANCAPSRACVLTGQYVSRHGVYTVDSRHRFDRGVVGWGGRVATGPNVEERLIAAPECAQGIGAGHMTVGTALQQAGYRTGYFGKWHAGWGGSIPLDAFPDQCPETLGFDESMLCGPRHFKMEIWPTPKEPIPEDTYLTDYLADRALAFIADNKDRPFFLFFSDFLVHVPLEAPADLVEKYKNKPAPGNHQNPTYAAMVEALDRSCGRILDKLDELGLAENTLVVFTSDNGGVSSNKKQGFEYRGAITSNYPLRGMKGMFTEGGIRVPAIVRWPGHINPGSSCNEPICGIDLFPTFSSIAQSPVVQGDYVLDGQNLVPLFAGKAGLFAGRDLFWYMPGYLPGRLAPSAVIRSGDYKLIHYFEDDRMELYNLRTNVGETQDMVATHPKKAQELKGKLDRWRVKTHAPIPSRNPNPTVGVMRLGGGWDEL